ncbi:MAG: PAS domain-containing protein [Polyangiaceae bacterium]|nr:PAS domain-containing protein [Polyangiaceae bacterium]
MRLGLRAKLFLVSVAVIAVAAIIADLWLRSEISAEVSSRAIDRIRGLLFVATIIALALAALMTNLAAHFMSREVRTLTDVARRLSAGELQARTRAAGTDDAAQLGRALDRLASSLSDALQDLRAERDLLGRVLDGMREGVLLVDKEGRVALANPALREMLLLGARVLGRRPLELVRSPELKQLLDRVTREAETSSAEMEVGELKPRRLWVHAAPLAGLGGTLAVFVDVTDVRRLENMRKDFVANVSHELRTPIATVLSAAETLRSPGLSPELEREFLDIIERNASRLHRLVEDLLDLSRIESREFKLNLEPLPVRSAVEPVVSLYRERAEQKHVRVSIEVADELKVQADARALDTVLSNLVDNALKYTSERSTVTICGKTTDASIAISVSDTGPGIAAKHLPRLFERFYRADAGRSRELGGTGLGLSIVKNLTEAMGGTVEVQSDVGHGSRFTVSLPRG